MDKIILANKKIGETPLDVIKKIKEENPKLKDTKMAYAGRLDPMAEGLLIILTGDECKNRERYQNLNKEYEFEILFGIATDTYDLLGKITDSEKPRIDNLEKKLKNILPEFVDKSIQNYPPYSAARVKGKPLYYWARRGELDKISIPSKKIEIYSLTAETIKSVAKDDLFQKISDKLSLIHGNFRQEEIKALWENYFSNANDSTFSIAKFKINCSSGTYVRSLSNDMGKKLGINALALSIKRISIGNYRLS